MIKILKKLNIFVFILIGFVPLLFTGNTLYPWHFGKTIIFSILVLLFFVLNNFCYFDKNIKLNFLSIDLFVLLFYLSMLISNLFSLDLSRSFWGTQSRAQGFLFLSFFYLFYILLIKLKDTKYYNYFLNLSFLVVFLNIIIAFLARYFHVFSTAIPENSRLSGLIGNPIFFAGYLLIPLYLSIYFYFFKKDKKIIKYFYLSLSLLILIALIFTKTRGSFLAIILSIFFACCFFRKDLKRILFNLKNLDTNKKIIKIFFLSFLILLFVIVAFNNKRIFDFSINSKTFNTRIMAWQIALKGFFERPILGFGGESYRYVFDKYYDPSFLKYSFAETVWDKPHNVFLEVILNQGVVGSLLLIIIFFVVVKQFLSVLNRNNEFNEKYILLLALFAYLVFDFFEIETTNSLIWLIILLVEIRSVILNFFEYKINFKFNIFISRLIRIFIILFFAGLIVVNIFLYKGSSLVIKTFDASDLNSFHLWISELVNIEKFKFYPFSYKVENTILFIKELNKFDSKKLIDLRWLNKNKHYFLSVLEENVQATYDYNIQDRIWLSNVYSLLGEYVDKYYFHVSNSILQDALKINKENQKILLIIAKNFLLNNQADKAISLLEESIKNNNNYVYPEIYWFLGVALVNKDLDQAIKYLELGSKFGCKIESNIFFMIELYERKGEYKKIVGLYKKLLESNPNNSQYYASLAATYQKIGDKESALFFINKAVEIDPRLKTQALEFIKKYNLLDN